MKRSMKRVSGAAAVLAVAAALALCGPAAYAAPAAPGDAWIGNTYLDDSGRDNPASLNSTGDM